jgi:hypothetical protein
VTTEVVNQTGLVIKPNRPYIFGVWKLVLDYFHPFIHIQI